VSLIRVYQPDGKTPRLLRFQFSCRYGDIKHVKIRNRMKTSDGTNRLLRTAIKCDEDHGVISSSSSSNIVKSFTYSPTAHRTMIALRATSNHRPMNSVTDAWYHQEVQMLRPGTPIPSPATVSNDIKNLYKHGSQFVAKYLVCLLYFIFTSQS
jgi:hypothetical protein